VIITEWTSTLSDVEVTARLQARGIASGPVLSLTDVGRDPHLWARSFFHRVDHPAVGSTVVTSSPWRLADAQPADRPAPTFGQHNHQILRDLGYDEVRIQQLTDAGVVATAPRM
jgi:crotonobetainyl-CoA:carnitine CoA-transferase CaiB-like acyl-CoA transferase